MLQNLHDKDIQLLLTQLEATEGLRTLGMKLEPALQFDPSVAFIINKITQFLTRMSGAPISPEAATTAYRVWFTKSIFYGMESINLNKKQCEVINKAWTTPWLHRLGFSSKTNINIRHMLQGDGGVELF